MGLFSRKSKKEKMLDQYNKMLNEAHKLSHTDRKASDMKRMEAEEYYQKIQEVVS